ncbi:putative protein kinase RLK-Pelle-LysM family [Helianthus debilis subsp. tardiflorus]
MLELSLRIRLVAFLFFNSTCFTSLVQSVSNRNTDLGGLYYAEQRNDLGSISLYINTSTNTDTNSTLNYNPNRLPSLDMYKMIANLTSVLWIYMLNDSDHINCLGNLNMTLVCLLMDNSSHVVLCCDPWRKETQDSVTSAEDLTPNFSPYMDLNILQFLRLQHYISFRYSRQPLLIAGIIVENTTITFFSGRYVDVIVGDRLIDVDRNHPPLKTCSEPGLSHGAIVGITLGVLIVVMSHAMFLYNGVYRKKKTDLSSALLRNGQVQLMHVQAPNGSSIRCSESSGALAAELACITVDKAVEFSYEELSKATNDFSLGNKIGQGGFGSVYYAELRGERAAIKKMDMQASKEFLAELKVLTHVHHKNLVRLIGYCVKGSHFLVYEYIENGNLSQHLHGSGMDPLSWSSRVQIALDSARGLEYIHEYTVSVFIHCDIKSANILIDKNFHGKVADFGLTRLTDVGSRSRLRGTFGYMSPEYVQYGDVSPKVDVFAFGVVLYQLISAKTAIIKANGSDGELKGLIALFDEVLSQTDLEDGLVKMIDPRLGDNYPLDSVHKMAQLAKACTHEDPQRRPHMRSIVVALMNLTSSMED